MPAGPKFGLVYGDTFRLGSDARLGVSAGLSYDSSYGTETGSTHGPDFTGDKIIGNGATLQDYPRLIGNGYDYTRSKAEVSLGLLANVTFSWNQWNRIGLTGFLSRTGIDLAQHDDDLVDIMGAVPTPHVASYPNAPVQHAPIETTAWRFRDRLDYRERELGVLALAGEHLFPATRDGVLSWAAALANASQDQPDSRRITYTQPYGKDYYEIPMGTEQDGLINRQWRKVDEDQRSFQFSWKQPLGRDSSLTLGATVTTTDRIYRERLGTAAVDGLADPPRYRPFDAPSDIWEYAITTLRISSTIDQDRTIAALFLKGETPLVSRRLRLSGGLRFERTKLGASGFGQMPGSSGSSSILHYMTSDNRLRGYFPQMEGLSTNDYAAGEARATPHIDQVDFLPMASLTWNPIDPLTFRLSASKTIARPSMREVGNYYTWNFDTERYQHGNGFLEISDVRNLDFRAEYFFGQGDLVALSLFRKLIEKPIEMGTVVMPRVNGAKAETWFNNNHTARLTGVEFEFRKNLGFLGDVLSGLSLGGNAAWIDASVDHITFSGIGGGGYERQLYDQPRWLANLDVTWEIRRWGSTFTLAWFATDRVLSAVDREFDQYLDSHERFDLTFTQRLGKRLALKLSVKNLSDPERRYIRDKDQTGGITIVDRRWHDGRSFTATLSAEF
jgi:outer membrane receptor protein involved in Fe transport